MRREEWGAHDRVLGRLHIGYDLVGYGSMDPEKKKSESHIRDYLRATTSIASLARTRIGGFSCVPEFLLHYGRTWTPAHKLLGVMWGKPRECYRNAALLALARDDLIYCEGYALVVIPIPHAWCLTLGGEVVENTIRDDSVREYFGVAVRTNYLRRSLLTGTRYGLLDDYERRWPMLRHSAKRWRHPITDL